MPRAADAFLTGSLPRSHDPLARIDFQTPLDGFVDPLEILEMWVQWFLDYGLEALSQVTGIDFTVLEPLLGSFTDVAGFITNVLGPTGLLATFDDFLGAFPGLTGGLSGLSGITALFGDLSGLLGSPTDLGSGSPILPGVTSIPLLGGLFSGATLLTTLIPGLDASKITSGTLGQSLIPSLTSGWGGTIDAAKLFGFNTIGAAISGTYTQSNVYSGTGSITAASMATMTNSRADEATATALDSAADNYVKIDLGSSQYVDHITVGYDYLSTLGAGDWDPSYTEGWVLQASNDNSTWTSLGTVPSYASSGAVDGIISMSVGGTWRYLRLYYAPAAYRAVTEFAAYGDASSAKDLLDDLVQKLYGGNIIGATLGSAVLQPVIDAVSLGFGGSSGLGFSGLQSFLGGLSLVGLSANDLIALFPGTVGGLSGTTGLGSILTDLTGILGSPTGLGGGTPTLPGISSIPVLGGLLSGGNILASIIPGLDASKITSGTFGTGLIPGLDAAKIISGTFGTSLIPNLPASIITSGIFGTSLIPNLPASIITSGIFGTGQIPDLDAAKIISGTFGAGQIPGLDASKITSGTFAQSTITNLISDLSAKAAATTVTSGFQNIYNNWFGGTSASGTPTEAGTTVAAIRTAVAGGYTLQTFTSSNSAWSVPPELADATEAYAVAIGGGGKGMPGTTTGSGIKSLGGSSGGYNANQFDPSTLGATLNVTVGAAASTNGGNGGTTSILNGATKLAESVVNVGAMSQTQGYAPSNSKPGAGGQGGSTTGSGGSATAGTDGESNAVATGGAGGAGINGSNGTGNPGGAGGAGQTSATPLAGGGGGGGGGARFGVTSATGGVGGAGGFPGGGSGGGGSAGGGSTTGGQPGTPANGFAALLWR